MPRVVFLARSADERARVVAELRRRLPDLQVAAVGDAAGFERVLAGLEGCVVVTGDRLGWSDGAAVLRAVKERRPDCPVILFAARARAGKGVATARAGFDDFVPKSPRSYGRLAASIQGALERLQRAGPRREEERRYRKLFDEAPVGMFRSTPAGQFLDVNPALVRILGYPDRESLLAENAEALYVDLEDRRRWREVAESQGEVRNYELRLRRRDGGVVWTRNYARAVRDDAGATACYEGVVVDITDSRLSEEALRESEERYRVVAETAADGIITIDEHSRILFVNGAAQRIFGYAGDELVGQPLTLLMPPELHDRHRAGLRRYAETGVRGMPWEGMRLPGRHKSGRELALEVSLGEHLKAGRRTITGIVRDVTERRRLEEQLRQSQKMEAVGRLAGGVAHDFNNLLTVIMGHGELVLGRAGLDEASRRDLEEIGKAAARAGMLTRRLLAFSRRQVVRPRVLELNDVVADMEKLLRRLIGEDVELLTELDPAAGRILADPGQLEQVLMNLAVNARDAMPQGGRLVVRTAAAQLEPACAGALGLRPGRYARLAVSDSGTGMDEQVRARLFEPFFTTKEPGKGTGLGLSTVYGIVSQFGGAIQVESAPGRGSEFIIYLPQEERPAEGPEGRLHEGLPGGRETVLLVEDEDTVRAVARDTLRRCGYAVLEARDGAEALALAASHPSAIQLVIADVVMPGMSGPDLVARLSRERPGIRVLYVSGHPEPELLPAGALDPSTPLLQKPFTPEALARAARGALDQATSPAAC